MRRDKGQADRFLRATHDVKQNGIVSGGKIRKLVIIDLSSDRFGEGRIWFYRYHTVSSLNAGISRVDQYNTIKGDRRESRGK